MKQLCIYLRGRLSTAFSFSWYSSFSHIFNMWNALCFLFTCSIMPSHWHILHSFSTFMKLFGAGGWPWGRVPTSFQTLFLLILFLTCIHRTQQLLWPEQGNAERGLPQSAGGVYWALMVEGLKELGNPFRFSGEEEDCQFLFLWPCNS